VEAEGYLPYRSLKNSFGNPSLWLRKIPTPNTHSTRRLDNMAFIVIGFLYPECFMLGARRFGRRAVIFCHGHLYLKGDGL